MIHTIYQTWREISLLRKVTSKNLGRVVLSARLLKKSATNIGKQT
jgi:hypothetical protein